MNSIYIKDYYSTPNTKKIIREIKEKNHKSIPTIAKEIQDIIPNNSIIIPTPSREGFATDTLILAKEIQKYKKILIKDIVKGKPRESLFELKRNNTPIPEDFFNFKLIEESPIGTIFILDIVYDTGITTNTIKKLIPNSEIITYAKVITKKPISINSLKIK